MRELTQEEAERCERACELLGDKSALPGNPYFWFGRLWDRALELAEQKNCFVAIIEGGVEFDNPQKQAMDFAKAERGNYCLALCEAIEQFTAAPAGKEE